MNAFAKKLKPLARLSKALILTLIAISSLGASKCDPNAPTFKWNPELWAADSRSESIVHQKSGVMEQIKCQDERFDSMICLHKSEPRKAKEAYFEVINQCQTWKKGTNMNAVESFMDNELSIYMDEGGLNGE